MKTFTYTIQDKVGIHARPAAVLVQEARKFAAELKINVNGESADLKRIFALMTLGIKQGMEVTVTAEGADEDVAAAAMKKCLEDNL